MNKYYGIIEKKLSVILALLISLYFIVYLFLWDHSKMIVYDLVSNRDMFPYIMYTRIIRFVIGVSASVFLVLLFNRVLKTDYVRGLSSIMAAGRETLGIYILQDIIVIGIISKIPGFRIFDEYLFSLVIAPVFSMIVLWICYKIVRIIKRNDRVGFYLLGVRG